MNVTKYPAEWVNAVAPSTPASTASTHDKRVSLSNVSRSMKTMLSKSYTDGRAGTAIQVRLTSICYEFGDRPQWDGKPTRPVTRFVTRLVNGLVQLVRRQNQRRIARVDTGCRRITVAESSSVALHPLSSTRGQLLVGGLVDQRSVGGVVERSQHPCHVAQHGVRCAPLLQRLARLTLEVDQQPRLGRAQHLSQMQVTVHPLHRDDLLGQLLEPMLDRRRVLLELGHRPDRRRQPGQHGVDRERGL